MRSPVVSRLNLPLTSKLLQSRRPPSNWLAEKRQGVLRLRRHARRHRHGVLEARRGPGVLRRACRLGEQTVIPGQPRRRNLLHRSNVGGRDVQGRIEHDLWRRRMAKRGCEPARIRCSPHHGLNKAQGGVVGGREGLHRVVGEEGRAVFIGRREFQHAQKVQSRFHRQREQACVVGIGGPHGLAFYDRLQGGARRIVGRSGNIGRRVSGQLPEIAPRDRRVCCCGSFSWDARCGNRAGGGA